MPLTVQREELDALEPEWREILPRCGVRSVFLSPAFLRAWWSELAGGRELVLLSVRDGGELTAVVPLMRDGPRLTFAGNTKVCDYMDITCVAGREAETIGAVLHALGEEPWDELVLWAVREDSSTLAALSGLCSDLGLVLEREVEDVCPQIAIPGGGWEGYLATLDKKDRHELRRKLRKLPQAGDVELEVLTTPEEVTAALDDFLRMHRASRAEKAAFMDERMEGFFRRLVSALAPEGHVEMTFLKLAGHRAAAVLCFDGDGETLLYNSGYEPAFAPFSVGLLSKVLALQRAIESGKRRFDFLRGAERYKYDLGAKDFAVHRVTVRRLQV